jgi:hypothetical protein
VYRIAGPGPQGILSKSTSEATTQVTAPGLLQKSPKTSLSPKEISAGLKEALRIGSEKAAAQVSASDGFFKDEVIKILMPEEARKPSKTACPWPWQTSG